MRIRDYFRAGYPLLWVQTSDYERAQNHIRDEIRAAVEGATARSLLETRWAVWRVTDHLKIYPLEEDDLEIDDSDTGGEEPIDSYEASFSAALEILQEYETTVAVFHNADLVLDKSLEIQRLIDTAIQFQTQFSMIVLLGPSLRQFPELQNLITHVPFDLPTKNELVDLCLDKVAIPHLDMISNCKVPAVSENRFDEYRSEFIAINKDVIMEVVEAATGLESYSAVNAFALSVNALGRLDPEIIRSQKKEAISRSEGLEYFPQDETMGDVGGFNVYKEWLQKRAAAFSREAADFGIVKPKGVLFTGIPGTGKSLAAKATAATLKLPLVRFDVSKVFGEYVGESERRMSTALKTIEAISPCVFWIDEVEKGFAGGRSSQASSGVTSRLIGMLLQWRQETAAGVFLVCTCNDIDGIPPEFYRPGRIDALFATTLPLQSERQDIFSIHLRKRGRDRDNFDLALLASRSEGFTGAEIELSVQEALLTAFSEDRELTTDDILASVKEISPHRMSERKASELDRLKEWIEAWARPVSSPEEHKIKQGPRNVRPIARRKNKEK